MKYFVLLGGALMLFASCNQTMGGHPKRTPQEMAARMDSLKSDLLKTDVAFSQMSVEKGRNNAFLAYADDNATFLRPFSMPITGKDTITRLFNRHPDSSCVLTWMPISADVARSGDLGFTYGTYSLDLKSAGKEEGTYCTVWKKDKNHQWKFVMDTGNEGLNTTDAANDPKTDKAEKKMLKGATGKAK